NRHSHRIGHERREGPSLSGAPGAGKTARAVFKRGNSAPHVRLPQENSTNELAGNHQSALSSAGPGGGTGPGGHNATPPNAMYRVRGRPGTAPRAQKGDAKRQAACGFGPP